MTPVPDDVALDLHDRLTRRQQLTAAERAMLEEWYAGQDSAEGAMLGAATGTETIGRLQEQLGKVLTSIADVSTRIAKVVTENDSIRRENAALRRRIAQQAPSEAT